MQVPTTAWTAPAANLLQYIPSPNVGNDVFSTSAYNLISTITRALTASMPTPRWGLLTAYYFLDNWSQNNPYPVAQGGANVPGFNALYTGPRTIARPRRHQDAQPYGRK